MRESLLELSVAELKNLYIHETKALTFALEEGLPWEDLKYVRDSITDISRCMDAKTPPPKFVFSKRSVDIIPLSAVSPDQPIDTSSLIYQHSVKK